MAREQVAGAIILNQLRERLVSGLYLGYWQPGDRLPSIREIAEAEHVDRKTAAAAYRRLQEEGLVRVRARSGVYLCGPSLPDPLGPLERLYRRWLEHTYAGARALGLDTRAILRLVGAVGEVERARLPVIECNWAQAEALATELHERLGVHAMACILDELRPGDPLLAEAPLLVTTPYHSAEVALLAPGRTIIEATMPPEVLRDLAQRAARGSLVVVVDSTSLADKVRRALNHCAVDRTRHEIQVVAASDRGELIAATRQATCVFLWPGAPKWVEDVLNPHVEAVRPARSISDESMSRIQAALLEAAIRRAKSAPPKPEELRAFP